MAETLLFTIPEPDNGYDYPISILWYQSSDGYNWGTVPIDTILVSNLVVDTETGKYKWASILADPTKYHQLKTKSINDIESTTGYIIPPRPIIEDPSQSLNVSGIKLDQADTLHEIGDKIELILQVDNDAANLIGDSINIHIVDISNSILATIIGSKIGDNIYTAEWTIPFNLPKLYNLTGVDESYLDVSYYHLKDRWLMSDGSSLEFQFRIKRSHSNPTSNNGIIKIVVSGVESEDGAVLSRSETQFTTRLSPFYCPINDVLDIISQYINEPDKISIATNIIQHSKNVDYTMRPDIIKYQDRYDNAVRNYVAYDVAEGILVSQFDISSETKELDTFKVSKEYSFTRGTLKSISNNLEKFGNIILAGGEDTPFKTKNFIKGLFDPNRPTLTRSKIDTSDQLPYLNTSASSVVIRTQDGDSYELRGYRTISQSSFGAVSTTSVI